jgi:hypothetical protein
MDPVREYIPADTCSVWFLADIEISGPTTPRGRLQNAFNFLLSASNLSLLSSSRSLELLSSTMASRSVLCTIESCELTSASQRRAAEKRAALLRQRLAMTLRRLRPVRQSCRRPRRRRHHHHHLFLGLPGATTAETTTTTIKEEEKEAESKQE